ncbi:MAG TPA: hypothetical protein VH599_08095 [Ktedonobacterales bacterium]|jgi:hypothetical protein
MLKADTRLWKETLEDIVYPVLFFALGTWMFKGVPLWQVFTGTCLPWLLRGGIRAARNFGGLWRVEQRRQAAAKRYEWVPLAQPQPIADPAVLPLPCMISSKPGWLFYPLMLIVIWIVIILWMLVWIWQYAGPPVHALVLSLIITLPLSSIWYLAEYQWIEAREEGLTIRSRFRRRSIHWDEARLFAIDATVKTDQTPDRYELSSATTILRWSRKLESSRFTRLSSPIQEYARQMDSLLALIAARTGLPLYDLRDWRLPPLPAPPYPPTFSLNEPQPNVPKA